MTLHFSKYQGTGNDFVIIDNRQLTFPKKDTKLVNRLCDRKFGIGADGLILLEEHPTLDFKMVYYNADGNQSSMCGNGGRCVVAFAKALNVISNETTFEAVDGEHKAVIDENDLVHQHMQDVQDIKTEKDYFFLDTGSPHHVTLRKDVREVNVKEEGAALRYSELYGKAGSNINFVAHKEANSFAVRTYERGVEDETLSCGTGVTAVALAMYENGLASAKKVDLEVEGGNLTVTFDKNEKEGGYHDIYLIGPANFVFDGTFVWNN